MSSYFKEIPLQFNHIRQSKTLSIHNRIHSLKALRHIRLVVKPQLNPHPPPKFTSHHFYKRKSGQLVTQQFQLPVTKMSSTAASTATGTSGAPSATGTCGSPSLYDIPVGDIACAVPYGGNHTDVMSKCCKTADVVSYAGDCGLYCLAIDQDTDELTRCFYDNGIAWQDAFCNGEGNDTATATGNSAPTATGASVVSGSGSSATKTGSSSSSSSTGDSSAAAPVRGISAMGVTISGLLLSSVMLGVLQL